MPQELEGAKWEVLAALSWLGVLLLQVRTAWEPLLQNLSGFATEEEGMGSHLDLPHMFLSVALLQEGRYSFLHVTVVSASIEERKEKRCVWRGLTSARLLHVRGTTLSSSPHETHCQMDWRTHAGVFCSFWEQALCSHLPVAVSQLQGEWLTNTPQEGHVLSWSAEACQRIHAKPCVRTHPVLPGALLSSKRTAGI